MAKHPNENNCESDEYQEIWNKFVAKYITSPCVLLPLEVGMNKDAEFYRRRMKAGDISKIWKGIKNNFPHHMQIAPSMFDNPKEIFGQYVDYFEKIDGSDVPPPRTPLDLEITRPTWLLFSLDNPNWKFSEKAQFSTENDPDDLTRNFVKIAMFNDPRMPNRDMHGQPMNTRKLLLLANRNRSAPEGLKYNLHVDVLQTLFGKPNSTAIIIDPNGGNNPDDPFQGP